MVSKKVWRYANKTFQKAVRKCTKHKPAFKSYAFETGDQFRIFIFIPFINEVDFF